MYTSELARHQNRVVLFRYNLDLSRVFRVVNTPVYNHAKPSNNVWSPLINDFYAEYGVIFIVLEIQTIYFPDILSEVCHFHLSCRLLLCQLPQRCLQLHPKDIFRSIIPYLAALRRNCIKYLFNFVKCSC